MVSDRTGNHKSGCPTCSKYGFDPNKDFFLYKFFGKDPKASFDQTFVTTKNGETLINLKEVWAYSLGKVQDYINSVGQFAFIIQGNESPFTSLEVDIKGTGQYKLDTD
jgi:hypothetical protein